MIKHYVEFLSPGTLVDEVSVREVDSWNIFVAVEMARKITERHGATPYGFRFTTRERGEEDFDSKQTKVSGTYFLGGRKMTVEDVRSENNTDGGHDILISNMEANGMKHVVVNDNSWRSCHQFIDGDALLEFTP